MITYVPERLRSANIRSGVIGSLARDSISAKPASRIAEATNEPIVTVSLQPSSAARMKP